MNNNVHIYIYIYIQYSPPRPCLSPGPLDGPRPHGSVGGPLRSRRPPAVLYSGPICMRRLQQYLTLVFVP